MFRDMRRFKQKLTESECEAVLQKQKRGVLAVLGDGGYPYTVPMNYIYDNGCIYYHSAVEGHKLDAVRACDKGSFNVLSDGELTDDGWSYNFLSVTAFGRLDPHRRIGADRKAQAFGSKILPDRRDGRERYREERAPLRRDRAAHRAPLRQARA